MQTIIHVKTANDYGQLTDQVVKVVREATPEEYLHTLKLTLDTIYYHQQVLLGKAPEPEPINAPDKLLPLPEMQK